MGEGEFGSLDDGAKIDLDPRLAGIFDAAGPSPAHDQPLGLHDFEILAAALVLAAVEQAEAHAEAAADLRTSVSASSTGPASGPHQLRDAFRRGQRLEHDRRPGRIRRTSVRLVIVSLFLASASLLSA